MTQKTEPVTTTVKVGGNMTEEERAKMSEALAAASSAVPKVERQIVTQRCLRCGHDPEHPNKPNNDDIQEYARSILGGRQFKKTYNIMGGQLQFRFKTLNGVDSEHLNNLVLAMNHIEDAIVYNKYAIKYRTLFCLEAISINGKEEAFVSPDKQTLPAGDFDKLDAMFSERIEKHDQGIVQMMAQSLNLFRELEAALIQAAFDETFWRGAGPC